MKHLHSNRDQAMSCLGYHSGAHGANHFIDSGVLVIDEQFAEMFDEGATGTRAHAIEQHRGQTVSLLSDMVDRAMNEHHGSCPQGMDCFGDSRPRPILTCVCGFRGCKICTDVHEQSAHPQLQTSWKGSLMR